jgi:hypothetical protein
MAKKNETTHVALDSVVTQDGEESIASVAKANSFLETLQGINVTHEGVTLSYDNMTPDALRYLLDMGLKQSLSDVGSVNRAKIVGTKGDGTPAKDAWSQDKITKEGKRLGVYIGDREAFADAWIADATNAKFARILSGELTVSESGERTTDPTLREAKRLIEATIAMRCKANKTAVPTGKALSDLVKQVLSDDVKRESWMAKARKSLAEIAADDLGDITLPA